MKEKYVNISIIFTHSVLFFVLLNLIAYLIPSPLDKKQLEELYLTPKMLLKKDPELMQRIHQGKQPFEITALYTLAPNIKSHPSLEFMSVPSSNNFYHVGFENCRYNDFVNEKNIRALINNSTWIFGGSTAFGFGVTDNETIAYYLNQLDTTNTYINLGVINANQKMEIEKLILLLQKGFRPARVIFLDGLNDLYNITESTFHHSETPNRSPNGYSHDFSLGTIGINKNLIYALPIVKLYYVLMANHILASKKEVNQITGNIYEQKSLYNTDPFLHYVLSELYINQEKNTQTTINNLFSLFHANSSLIRALSKEYCFEYKIFLQPVGPFLERNPFIRKEVNIKNSFRLFKNVFQPYINLTLAARQGRIFPFCDLSNAHDLCENPYVDLTHYSSSMNKKLAELILLNLK